MMASNYDETSKVASRTREGRLVILADSWLIVVQQMSFPHPTLSHK